MIERDPLREPIIVQGWRVTALVDQVYPTLVLDPRAVATGELLTDLTPHEWHALDTFENPDYELTRIQHAADHAWAYTAAGSLDPSPWIADNFRRDHLDAYLGRCAAWRQRYEAAGRQNRSSATAE